MMTKDELEKRKLELEVRKLQVKWHSNIEFWKVFIPTIAVLVSLYFTFGKGIVDAEKTKLEIQKEQLKLDIARFETRKDELSKMITIQDSVKIDLGGQILKFQREKDRLTTLISKYKVQLQNAGVQIKNIEDENADDQHFYLDALALKLKEERASASEFNDLQNKLDETELELFSTKAEVKFLKKKTSIDNVDQQRLESEKFWAQDSVYEKQRWRYDSTMKKLESKFKEKTDRFHKMSPKDRARQFTLSLLEFESARQQYKQ